MSSVPIIVCQECKSFRVKKLRGSLLLRLGMMLRSDPCRASGRLRSAADLMLRRHDASTRR
jgi:hypothetical protein